MVAVSEKGRAMYTNAFGTRKYKVGDSVDFDGVRHEIVEFKGGGMVVVRYLNKNDAWVYRVMSPDSLGLYEKSKIKPV